MIPLAQLAKPSNQLNLVSYLHQWTLSGWWLLQQLFLFVQLLRYKYKWPKFCREDEEQKLFYPEAMFSYLKVTIGGCEENNLLTFLPRREVVPPEASLRDIKFRDGMLKASWRCVGRNFEARQALPCEHKYSNSTICNFSHWTSTPIILKFKCKCRKNLRLVGREGLLCSSKLFRINSISFQTSIF